MSNRSSHGGGIAFTIFQKVSLGAVLCTLFALASCQSGSNSNNGGNGGTSGSPALTAAVAASGNFSSNESNASYTITVSNTGTAATSGAVTVTDPPVGFTIATMTGSGWTCTVTSSAASCTRSDSLANGQSFPAITVTGTVTATNGTPVSIPVSLSGGGMSSTVAVSPTPTVTVAAPVLSITKSHNGSFDTGQQNALYTVTIKNGASAGATSGKVTVTEAVPSGETLVSMAGSGWTCPGTGGASTCDRSDSLATGGTYPAVTVTVNVAANAATPQVNQVSVSGGGTTSTASTSDSTTIIAPQQGPDLSILTSNSGNFGAGTNDVFTLAVTNAGNASTTGTITVTDTLASQFTFVSAGASGWTCGAASQVVTCTNPGPLTAAESAPPIPLVVGVSSSASGSIANTATVATAGDTNSTNNSSTDNVTVISPTSEPSVVVTPPGPVTYAGGNAETFSVQVTNDAAGDVLTPSLSMNGTTCTSSTCGTLGSVTGSSGSYTIAYTPPASVSAVVTVTITVASSLSNSFSGTASFPVEPAGIRAVTVSGPGMNVVPGSAAKSLSATVYNPGGSDPGASLELLGAGYACPVSGGGTVCGTLTTGATTSGTTTTGTTGIAFTTVAFTYTPPAAVPNSPYDRPEIVAVSKADASKVSIVSFVISTNAVSVIANNSRLNTALTGGAPVTISASVTGDNGVNKTVNWSLTAGGASCQPTCGSLGSPAYTRNGVNVTATIIYTPPATVPTGAADEPVISVTPVDAIGTAQETDSVGFQINDGTCGTGNNSILNGQYAFLVRGGASGQGYVTWIGSFTADGSGNITAGSLDINRTGSPLTGLSIVTAGSSYSVDSDNRGCLTLVNSSGGTATFRIALGTLDGSNHATQGQLVRFDDTTGNGQRLQGVLKKQDTTSFANSALSGNYAFGYQGVDDAGGRVAMAGVCTADGAGHVSSFDLDIDDNGTLDTNDTGGTATYTIGATGRGTLAVTSATNSNYVFYMVSSSDLLVMSTDAVSQNLPILSGEDRKQTTTSYTQTSLDGNAYVFYETAIDTSDGSNGTVVAQVQFSTNGVDTGEQDLNDNGTLSVQTIASSVTIGSNGRVVLGGDGGILYLIGTDSGFIVGVDDAVASGYGQQQTGGPFTNASLSGQFFFGGGAPVPGGSFDSGTTTADGIGTLTVNLDDASPNGIAAGTQTLSYAVTASSPAGKLTITEAGSGQVGIGYVISGSQIVFMSADTTPNGQELFTGQK